MATLGMADGRPTAEQIAQMYAGIYPSAPQQSPNRWLTDTGNSISFGDLTAIFNPTPHASSSVNNQKDQTRLANTSVLGRAGPDVVAYHGIAPAAPTRFAQANVPIPRPRPAQAISPRIAVTAAPVAPANPRLAYAPAPVVPASPAVRAIGDVLSRGGSASPAPRRALSTFRGSSTGRTYTEGQRVQMGRDTFVTGADGSFQNERTRQRLPGSSIADMFASRSINGRDRNSGGVGGVEPRGTIW